MQLVLRDVVSTLCSFRLDFQLPIHTEKEIPLSRGQMFLGFSLSIAVMFHFPAPLRSRWCACLRMLCQRHPLESCSTRPSYISVALAHDKIQAGYIVKSTKLIVSTAFPHNEGWWICDQSCTWSSFVGQNCWPFTWYLLYILVSWMCPGFPITFHPKMYTIFTFGVCRKV